jgi:hypothetical protein
MVTRERKKAILALCIALYLFVFRINIDAYAGIKGADENTPPSVPILSTVDPLQSPIPELVKTKPYKVTEILQKALGEQADGITDDSILAVQVIPIANAKGFAYFDGKTTWKLGYGVERPADFDNDSESDCWKVVGGMTKQEKLAELDPLDEGGAEPGKAGTGEIDIKVFYKNNDGGVSTETIRTNVILRKLIVEVDWMEGSFTQSIEKGKTQRIDFKPNISKEFIDAFGQAGVEVIIKDTPEKGNKHNIIPKDAVFAKNMSLNREDLSDLMPYECRNWRKDIKMFNEGISFIASGIIDKGYMDFDASRPDVIYVIGAQRWDCRLGDEIQQTRGATAILEHNGKECSVVFVFNRAIAESTAAVNKSQEKQVPWEAASVHTVLHECAAHCFPIQWKNINTQLSLDDYWNGWRYMFVGHTKRNERHEYGRIYKTCVTSSESTLDAAYHTWMGEPRLTDFSNRIGNSANDKCRDIIRDYLIEGKPKQYGRNDNEKRVVKDGASSLPSLSFK